MNLLKTHLIIAVGANHFVINGAFIDKLSMTATAAKSVCCAHVGLWLSDLRYGFGTGGVGGVGVGTGAGPSPGSK